MLHTIAPGVHVIKTGKASVLQVPARDCRDETICCRASLDCTNKQKWRARFYVALMEAHRELLSGKVPNLLLDAPTVAHPDNIGEIALIAEWNVYAITFVSSASIPALDLPPRVAGELFFSWRVADSMLDFS
jgi:hypothetical protein